MLLEQVFPIPQCISGLTRFFKKENIKTQINNILDILKFHLKFRHFRHFHLTIKENVRTQIRNILLDISFHLS